MVTATITIPLFEEFGLTEASREYPDAVFRYLSGVEEPDRGLGLVEVKAADIEIVLETVEQNPTVRKFELLDRYKYRAIFRYETDVAELYQLVREAGILPAFPYTVRDGVLTFRVTTSSDRLSRLGELLRARGCEFDVRSISHAFDETDVLTDHQWNVLETALEVGYYDSPRQSSLSDVAAQVGIAPSSASEVLHRAESRVIRWFVSRRDEW